MSYPHGQLVWRPLPGNRAHVVFENSHTGPVWCGSIPHEWLTNVTGQGHEAAITMVDVGQCDHAGTLREPRSVWTGEPTP